MTHLHSHHRNHAVKRRAPAFSPWFHLTSAPVSPLDFDASGLIPTYPAEQGVMSPLARPSPTPGAPLSVFVSTTLALIRCELFDRDPHHQPHKRPCSLSCGVAGGGGDRRIINYKPYWKGPIST